MRNEQDKKPTGPGRWKKGGQRYTAAQELILSKYKEPSGWRNGAKLRRK